jgi:Ca2+/Na+ antiporter
MLATAIQQLLFKETQHFPRWVIMLLTAPLLSIIIVAMFNKLTVFELVVPTLLSTAFLFLFISTRLITEVKDDGVYIKLSPFQQKFGHFLFVDIASANARQYSPIGEFGGWGIRYGFGNTGRAYNARGNQGVQLIFKDGKKLLIGSQHAEELANLIQSKLASR